MVNIFDQTSHQYATTAILGYSVSFRAFALAYVNGIFNEPECDVHGECEISWSYSGDGDLKVSLCFGW